MAQQTDELREVISEEEFLRLVHNAASDVLRIALFFADVKKTQKVFNKKLFYVIATTTRDLEDFLDDHGAKNNRAWNFFRDLVASARTFGFIAFLVEHIEKSHAGPQDHELLREYFDKTKKVARYLNQVLIHIFKLIREEAQRLQVSFPPKGLSEQYYYDIPADKILPQNLDEGEAKNEREKIIKVCSEYINTINEFEELTCDHCYTQRNLLGMIPHKVNEEKIRKFELVMHNLESVYDSYVKDTTIASEDGRLHQLRTLISITLHLLESARAFAHFYERHEKINTAIESGIKGNSVLNCTVNWALYYTHQMMQTSKVLANDLLKDYAARESVQLPIPKELGFHLRPSTLVAKVVNHYGSDVYLMVGEDKFDAKSILSITWAGGKIAREKIESVTFIGDTRVLKDLEILASVNYGEDHMGKDQPLPKELSYLR
jgi:hypothetical protein